MNNLKNALRSKNITIKDFATFLGVSEKTAQNKLSAKSDFTYSEVRKICKFLLPEYNSDYLFDETV